MIKIIEEGKKEFITVCSECGCKFSYELSDLYGICDYNKKIKCPCCKYEIYHPNQNNNKSLQVTNPRITIPPYYYDRYKDYINTTETAPLEPVNIVTAKNPPGYDDCWKTMLTKTESVTKTDTEL